MDNNELLRKCNKCKITKSKELFYKYRYCNRCHIKDYIKNHLLNARVANHLNLSIDKLNNIITDNMNDSTRDAGEHERYDEVIMYFTGTQSSTVITDNVINNFLDEIL